MTKVAVAEDLAAQIRASDGPSELVDAGGQTIGLVRRLQNPFPAFDLPPRSILGSCFLSRADAESARVSEIRVPPALPRRESLVILLV